MLVDAGIAVSCPQLEAGARIMAHANTRKRLTEAQRVEDRTYNFPLPPPRALPVDVFETDQTVIHGGVTIGLRYYGPAHSDGDIGVHFRDADILHTGDTYWNGSYPMMDYSTCGQIDGTINAAEANLRATMESTIAIPGHRPPVSDRAGLQACRDMRVGVRAKRGGAEAARTLARGDHGGQTDCRLGRALGQFRHLSRFVHQARQRTKLDVRR